MERQAVEVWKKLLKILRLMFRVAPTSDFHFILLTGTRSAGRLFTDGSHQIQV